MGYQCDFISDLLISLRRADGYSGREGQSQVLPGRRIENLFYND
jgi:hypothetical protein